MDRELNRREDGRDEYRRRQRAPFAGPVHLRFAVQYGPLYASIYPSHLGVDRMKADLLAAYLTGGTVVLYFTDSNCTVGELLVGGW